MVEKQQKGRRNDPRKQRRPREEKPAPIWHPTTLLGKRVKAGEVTDIDQIFDADINILEAEIVTHLLPGLQEDLLLIGQAKGKFGGGQRRVFRQTQKKTKEGNSISFTTCAVVGNKNGYVGIGFGKSKETVPARDKAKRKARLNIMRIRRGCGSWETDAREPNSIPFAVTGNCGSIRITLMPAPRGTGLCVEKESAKILALAGIQDIRSKTQGQTKTKLNVIYALIDALKKLSEMKVKHEDAAKLGLVEGKLKGEVIPEIQTAEEIKAENDEKSEVEKKVEVKVEETSKESQNAEA
ncbi:30S ribosomal protein S5 [Candidatus Woesearchaeota archaeon]|nr:30S ribosomal protein S5 [Candidatus Woesearchaeota archaeon]MBT4151172.1 30S ribosomal protein S5 [Candidatus Woesearchaeota archaeon]MBT4247604.1 30S ribosomal protein S5 [Candidatus Woesearchaeota archaeon]MBT4433950.1 30S ribosomal protein S5 [Candidatus Woesearchaeota archaeon]